MELKLSLQNLAASPLPLYTLLLSMSNARIPSPPLSPVSVPWGISPRLLGQRPACMHLTSKSTSRERTAGLGPPRPAGASALSLPHMWHTQLPSLVWMTSPLVLLPGQSPGIPDTLITINACSTAERLCELPCSKMIITSTPESCSNTPLICL